jgi:hypothetical protein
MISRTAAEIARNRLDDYLAEKLRDEDDLTTWEFYTWLLEKAKGHKVDRSGYTPMEYQSDHQQIVKCAKSREKEER